MTTLPERPSSAVVVVDVQNHVVANAHQRDEIVGRISDLVDRARAEAVPVIWVQHSDDNLPAGSDGWRYVPELTQRDGEPVVHKHYGDSFEDTTLEAELAERGVGRLIVAGAQTDACVLATIHGAFTRGYDTVLVGDGHTTEDFTEYGLTTPDKVIAHVNAYWANHDGPGRIATVVDAADVDLQPDGA